MQKRTRHIMMIACLAVALLLRPGGVRADFVTSNPGLPPQPSPPAGYMTATQVHAAYPGVTISEVDHTGFNAIQLVEQNGNEIENFNSVLYGVATIGATSVPFELTGPVSVEAFGKAGQVTGTFNTQMLSMDMTGTVAGHSVEIMLDPALGTSTGQTSITAIGGGMYRIDSFFDIFTELSLDGGPFMGQLNGPTVVTLQTVPEPSIWIMVAAAGLIVPAYLRRHGRGRGARPVPR